MKRFTNRLSPATVIACIALFVSLGGVSYGVATGSIDSREIKNNNVRSVDLRNNDVRSRDIRTGNVASSDLKNNGATGTDILESSLGKVPSASNADTVGGKSANDLLTSSGFNQNDTDIASLGAAYVAVASATITTHSAGRILANGSAEILGAAFGEEGQCKIVIDGTSSLEYETQPDDINPDPNSAIIAVNFARELPAGSHTAELQCRAVTGTVAKDDAAISVFGLGA